MHHEELMNIKSERLKKFENELHDLEQWLKLGLVPKKDIEKHKEEMQAIRDKIDEEKVRLRYLKEHGEVEEYTVPKRSAQARGAYHEPQSMPEMDMNDEGLTDAGLDMETESYDTETSISEETEEEGEEKSAVEEDDDDPFSDKNRWRRGVLEDPDNRDW